MHGERQWGSATNAVPATESSIFSGCHGERGMGKSGGLWEYPMVEYFI